MEIPFSRGERRRMQPSHDVDALALDTLTVLRGVLRDPVVAALYETLATDDDSPEHVRAYAELAHEVFECREESLRAHVLQAALDDDNAYVRCALAGERPSELLSHALDRDLLTLQESCMGASLLKGGSIVREILSDYPTGHKVDFVAAYHEHMADLGRRGFGMWARHHMFLLGDTGEIVPVRHPDTVRLSDLAGYEREKDLIIQNTKALLAGMPAANMLLTGDAGTGKSSTVKAVVNELADEGLRILEVRKDQLHLIPALLDELTVNPLHFILFIDDLSFVGNDDNYAALKAILEGSVSAKSQNVVVYATSNRRHLVKESFSERDGDDVHRNDTIQEVVSLSERFGIRVTFSKPGKDTYLKIVRQLVEDRGLALDEDDLALVAERYALRSGGRSARRARQFVDAIVSGSQVVRPAE